MNTVSTLGNSLLLASFLYSSNSVNSVIINYNFKAQIHILIMYNNEFIWGIFTIYEFRSQQLSYPQTEDF